MGSEIQVENICVGYWWGSDMEKLRTMDDCGRPKLWPRNLAKVHVWDQAK